MKIKNRIPKKTGRWVIILVVSFFLFLFLSGNDGIIVLFNAHMENKRLENRIISLQGTVDSLEIAIEKLKTDTAYIEKMAREKLGMAGKNEKVYKFIK